MIGSLILSLVLGPNLRQRFRRVYIGPGWRSMQQATGREFIWDFSEEARRIREVIPGLPITGNRFEEIIATCLGLEQQQRADRLIQLTLKENASAALGDLAGA
jgi:hypothetical protein